MPFALHSRQREVAPGFVRLDVRRAKRAAGISICFASAPTELQSKRTCLADALHAVLVMEKQSVRVEDVRRALQQQLGNAMPNLDDAEAFLKQHGLHLKTMNGYESNLRKLYEDSIPSTSYLLILKIVLWEEEDPDFHAVAFFRMGDYALIVDNDPNVQALKMQDRDASTSAAANKVLKSLFIGAVKVLLTRVCLFEPSPPSSLNHPHATHLNKNVNV